MYNKLESLYSLIDNGLNVHSFIATKDMAEVVRAVHGFDNVCTIRTDSEEGGYKLPFYIIDGESDELGSICNDIEGKGLLAIVANGRKYDKNMIYNATYSIDINGDFWIEYCMEKCTQREMYNYTMNCYMGNINDKIRDWIIIRDTDKRVDKREIRELLIRMWNNGIYDKYLEITKYDVTAGIRQEDIVFWQVTDRCRVECSMFNRCKGE